MHSINSYCDSHINTETEMVLIKLSSLAAQEVVKTTTSCSANAEIFIKMWTGPFMWMFASTDWMFIESDHALYNHVLNAFTNAF